MSDLPPAYDYIMELGFYDQLPSDVQTHLLNLPSYLPLPAPAKAEDAMNKHLEKLETQRNLTDEVKALGDSVVEVDEAFERVRQGLGKVGANDYKDKDGNPISKFQQIWVDYQTRWTALLWDSRDAATQTEAYIQQKFVRYKFIKSTLPDFFQIIPPIVNGIKTKGNLIDAKLGCDAFIKQEDPKEVNFLETINLEQKYSQDFTDLRRDLEIFKRNFDEDLRHQVELGVAIEKQTAILNSKIKRLDKEIINCIGVVIALGIALSATIYVTFQVVGALAGLGSIGPFIATGVVIISAIAAISSQLGGLMAYSEKTKEKREERTTAQKQLRELQVQLTGLKALQAIWENHNTDIPEICDRLDRFAAIWGTVLEIGHDVRLIQSGFNAAVDDEGFLDAYSVYEDLVLQYS